MYPAGELRCPTTALVSFLVQFFIVCLAWVCNMELYLFITTDNSELMQMSYIYLRVSLSYLAEFLIKEICSKTGLEVKRPS